MPLVTTGGAAEIISLGTGYVPADPSGWIRTLCATGILTDHGTGRRARLDTAELAQFVARHPYRRTLPFGYLGVSLLELEPVPAWELAPPHNKFRTHGGYDHRNTVGLSPQQRANAIVSSWPISRSSAQDVVDHGWPLIGCVRGVVNPDMIYWPTAVVPLGSGIGFRVDPDRQGHPEIPTGAILDVPRGNTFRLVPAGTTP
ncbi:hypothetical protein [Nocardia carnea]|uniref:hypothetical protein n=1 Tax=Nocardia carnea TaxID=37328 RepID=UPI000303A29D|nr:hypothetical protein [Nocardia carnea]